MNEHDAKLHGGDPSGGNSNHPSGNHPGGNSNSPSRNGSSSGNIKGIQGDHHTHATNDHSRHARSDHAVQPPATGIKGAFQTLCSSIWGVVLLAFLGGLGLSTLVTGIVTSVCQNNCTCNWTLASLFFIVCLLYASYLIYSTWFKARAERFQTSAGFNCQQSTPVTDGESSSSIVTQWGYDPQETRHSFTPRYTMSAPAGQTPPNMWQYHPNASKVCYRGEDDVSRRPMMPVCTTNTYGSSACAGGLAPTMAYANGGVAAPGAADGDMLHSS